MIDVIHPSMTKLLVFFLKNRMFLKKPYLSVCFDGGGNGCQFLIGAIDGDLRIPPDTLTFPGTTGAAADYGCQ